MSIGENIKRERERKGVTQQELADKVYVRQSMIAQIERGTKSCTMQLGAAIANALKCDVKALYCENTKEA